MPTVLKRLRRERERASGDSPKEPGQEPAKAEVGPRSWWNELTLEGFSEPPVPGAGLVGTRIPEQVEPT